MELRRHASHGHGNVHAHSRPGEGSRGRAERVVLTAHWLVSGYRLRAWRALACLLAAVLVATVGLRAVGFTHDRHSWSSAFLYWPVRLLMW